MTAMESATKNAGDVIEAFDVDHDKVPAGGITKEIIEICQRRGVRNMKNVVNSVIRDL